MVYAFLEMFCDIVEALGDEYDAYVFEVSFSVLIGYDWEQRTIWTQGEGCVEDVGDMLNIENMVKELRIVKMTYDPNRSLGIQAYKSA